MTAHPPARETVYLQIAHPYYYYGEGGGIPFEEWSRRPHCSVTPCRPPLRRPPCTAAEPRAAATRVRGEDPQGLLLPRCGGGPNHAARQARGTPQAADDAEAEMILAGVDVLRDGAHPSAFFFLGGSGRSRNCFADHLPFSPTDGMGLHTMVQGPPLSPSFPGRKPRCDWSSGDDHKGGSDGSGSVLPLPFGTLFTPVQERPAGRPGANGKRDASSR